MPPVIDGASPKMRPVGAPDMLAKDLPFCHNGDLVRIDPDTGRAIGKGGWNDVTITPKGYQKRWRHALGQFGEKKAKVIARIFKEVIDAFKRGLSAENYISLLEHPEPLRPAIFRTSWKNKRSPRMDNSDIQDIF